MSAVNNRFAVVPIEAFMDPELTPAELKMLGILYSFRDKNFDTVWPGLDVIKGRAGYSHISQVSRMTTKLEQKGWLDKSRKRGCRGTKIYKLTIPGRLLSGPEADVPDDLKCQVDRDSQVDHTAQTESGQFHSNSQVDSSGQVDNSERGIGESTDSKSQIDRSSQVDISGRKMGSPDPDCQLDANSQLDNSERKNRAGTDSECQLDSLGQLDANGQGQFDHLRQRQFAAEGQIAYEHTTEHTSEHSAGAGAPTAARAALPVDNSLEEISLAGLLALVNAPEGPKRLFDVGVAYLGGRGISEQRSRALVAKLITDHGEGLVFDAFQAMLEATPKDPIAYLHAVLQGRMCEIPHDWRPPDSLVAKFMGLGVPADVIRKERDALVEHHRRAETRHHDWADLFERRMTRHYERAEGDPGVMRSVAARSAGFDPQPFVEPTSL